MVMLSMHTNHCPCALSLAWPGLAPILHRFPFCRTEGEEGGKVPCSGCCAGRDQASASPLTLSFSLQNMASWPLSSLARDIRDADGNNGVPAFLHPGVLSSLLSFRSYIFLCHRDHISVNLSMFAWTAVVCASHSCYLPIYATYSILLVLDLFSCPKHTAS